MRFGQNKLKLLPQNATKYRGGVIMALTAKKIELLEAMLANPMLSDVKLAELLNLNNKTVGKWRKEEEFQQEMKKRLAEQWKDAERLAQKKMIELAADGCFQANKYILDSLNYAPAQRIEADLKTDIVIEIGE
jgi:hypothetical protein